MGMGTHLLVNMYGCPAELLKQADIVLKLLNEVVKKAKLKKIGESFFQFKPHGATAVILLKESHISIHTWPEKNSAAVDIYTCGDTIKNEQADIVLIKQFKPKKIDKKRKKR